VTFVGTVTVVVLLLVSVTVAPPAGAGPLSVTVPVAVVGAFAEETLVDTTVIAGGLTVTLAVLLLPA
jgi:hypothetical protein